ncbi:hypothetical protein ATU3B_02035 [Agrobacterium genomosp. 3 str. CIP 111-78]|uniref:Uncharacterized protein n=1 Tax=Agrobacterium tumefaciens TaxID=358 RepID=A0AAE6EI69_AGRTU|nr:MULTISPECIES: hypothetical protein [Agrobacterium tumefaciens complex]MCA2370392.1 hypothetical protein [Agrobacterium tomkonis CIP 111-78]QCL98787.1 hypothetical protein CFBP6624_00605 [Agrobacterium tumefaciens]
MADKKTPEELARSSVKERLVALSDKLLPALILLFGFSLSILSIANYFIPDTQRPVEITLSQADRLRANVAESKRLVAKVENSLAGQALPAEAQSALQDLNRTLETLTSDTEKMRPVIERNWIQQLVGEGPLTRAYAEEASQPTLAVAVGWMRQGIVVFMIVAITMLLGVFLIMYFKTTDPEKVKFADSMIRMIVGFYIGVVTGLLGIPPI